VVGFIIKKAFLTVQKGVIGDSFIYE